jgi:hypothetical protein
MRVYVADDPLSCVARGSGMVLENFDVLQKTLGQHESRKHAALSGMKRVSNNSGRLCSLRWRQSALSC